MPAEYKWIKVNELLLRVATGAQIPFPSNESEGFLAQAWINAGNVPDPPGPVAAPPDEADYDNQTRAVRAAVRLLGNYLGKTQSQIENDFRAAYLSA